MENSENKLLVPSAIIVAGLIVAGAIVYIKSPSAPTGGSPAVPNIQQVPASTADILKIHNGDFILGNPSAKVVFVEYADFQCPFCGKFFQTAERQIINQYVKTGKAVFVYRDFSFLGEESTRAAEAARCAGEEGKFWEYHDYLFLHQNGENQGTFADANLKKFAGTLKLDQAKFNACFDSGKYKKAIDDSVADGRSIGVNGTPASFINGQSISGAVPFATFQAALENALKK